MIGNTILCFVFLIYIINSFSPKSAGFMGIFLFFLVLFFFLVSLFTICGFYLRGKKSNNKVEFQQISISFRQAVFFAFIFSGILFLQSIQLLFWWSATLFIVGVALLEFYFINKD
ncbi:MAG: hypothetical protein KAS01_01650 [Candidatus Pacebacteria bacterium]|nr:hypothetical protein [Candidatus Paceibacterota bacterium]